MTDRKTKSEALAEPVALSDRTPRAAPANPQPRRQLADGHADAASAPRKTARADKPVETPAADLAKATVKSIEAKSVVKKATELPAATRTVARKALPAKPASAPAKAVKAKPAPAKAPAEVAPVVPDTPSDIESASTATFAKAASKTADDPNNSTPPPTSNIKDDIMDMTPNYTAGLNDAVADAQGKMQTALDKGSTAMGEANDFARANVEACVESGKILAAGLQDLGTTLVADGHSAFEKMTADLKELASVKSPAEFFKLQSELMRKSFDGVVASGSKNGEAIMKLASEAFAPISGRVSVAVDKARVAA